MIAIVKHEGEEAGRIVTNRSLTLEECLNLIGIDIHDEDEDWDWEAFVVDYESSRNEYWVIWESGTTRKLEANITAKNEEEAIAIMMDEMMTGMDRGTFIVRKNG